MQKRRGSAALLQQIVIEPLVVACMCHACQKPYFAALRTYDEMAEDNPIGKYHSCDTCGDVIRNLVFRCDCTDDPVFAVPTSGGCQHCGEELTRSLCDESVPKLRELLAR